MKEHPILFNGEMVSAILDGRKTQTRRVIKPQPQISQQGHISDSHWIAKPFGGLLLPRVEDLPMYCPYGQFGDLLWVRETWAALHPNTDNTIKRVSPQPSVCVLAYKATEQGYINGKWRSSRYMPRWASRITLRVVDVRVERVQEISHDDAYNEGIETDIWDQAAVARNYSRSDSWFQMWSSDLPDYVDLDNLYIESFRTLWDSINAARGFGWDINPWVWVVEFEKVTL